MSRLFNPAYNQVRKENKNRFTLVTRVPKLPEATASYEYTVLFDSKTDTFCKCVKRDGVWVWDAVTTPYKQFVTSAKVVNRMVDEEVFKFNDLVDALNVVINDLAVFGLVYSPLPPYEDGDQELTGADYKEFADKANEIIKDINRISGRSLELIDAANISGDNLEEARLKLNELIKAVNPHADLLNDIQNVINSGNVSIGGGNADLVCKAIRKWFSKTEKVGVVDEEGNPVIDETTGEQMTRDKHVNWDDEASDGSVDNLSIGEMRSLLAHIIKTVDAVYADEPDEDENPENDGN